MSFEKQPYFASSDLHFSLPEHTQKEWIVFCFFLSIMHDFFR